jgi:hypothetical protein
MKRITVEDVRRAYEVTKLQPIMYEYGDGLTCGCPLTAVQAEVGICRPAEQAERLSDCEPYAMGFVRGVDGTIGCMQSNDSFIEGYQDGLAVRNAIFGDTA